MSQPRQNSIRAVLIYETFRKTSQVAEPSPTGSALISSALQRLGQAFPQTPIYCRRPYPAACKSEKNIREIGSETKELGACLKKIERECQNETDSIALCYGWYPLLDISLVEEALSDHERYLAHFSYGENIPIGFLPDFASLEFLQELPDSVPEELRAFVLKHIEDYDVEIFYKNPDLRQYRLDFSTQSQRSQKLALEALRLRPDLNYTRLAGFIQKHPEVLRPYPSYFEIELCSRMPLEPFYWPLRKKKDRAASDFLAFPLIQKLLNDIQTNGMDDDISIALGGLGEPMEHPQLLKILQSFLKLKQTRQVYLETFGLHLSEEMVAALGKLDACSKLHIIVRLNSLHKERYQQMYARDGDGVYKNIAALEKHKAVRRPFRLYVEMLRMQENDNEIDTYFERFENSPFEVILQKYNRYIDLLPERRVANLNPLHQDFCWHLARDFYLTAQAEVPLCKQDPFATRGPALSFQKYTVSEILQKTMAYHNASVQAEYTKIPMPCEQCDEWYTFNG